jgi:hypothetical protein
MKSRLPNSCLRIMMIVVLTALLAGCSCFQADKDRNLAVWHSQDAPLDQRMEAASQLVPTGMEQTKVQRILGEPTRHFQFCSQVFYAPGYPGYEGATNVAYCSIERDVYDFDGGDYVALDFDTGPSDLMRQTRPVLGISIGNTNVDMFELTPLSQR